MQSGANPSQLCSQHSSQSRAGRDPGQHGDLSRRLGHIFGIVSAATGDDTNQGRQSSCARLKHSPRPCNKLSTGEAVWAALLRREVRSSPSPLLTYLCLSQLLTVPMYALFRKLAMKNACEEEMLKRFLQCSAAERQLFASQNQQQSNDLTRSAGEQQSSPFIPPDKPEPLHCLCHSLKAENESQQVWAALQCLLPTFSLPFPCSFPQGTTLCTAGKRSTFPSAIQQDLGVATTLGLCSYL